MDDYTDDSSFDEPTVLTEMPSTSPGEPQPGGYDRLPTASVHAGEVFAGRYRLEQQLAQRGGTLTWRAFDQKLSRSVLVHILAPHDPRSSAVLDAARKAAVATDSRFLRVLDAVGGEDPDAPALVVCEYAPGQSLEQLLTAGPLSALEAAWVVRELADSMGAMHDIGLFHQRLNPDTVIITATGNVKIVGFLIEASLHPDPANDPVAWSQREMADVQALGKLLYASLVSHWPVDPGQPQVATWSMPPAPIDSRGWVSPRQVLASVSPALDTICDQILSSSPRHNEMPLGSAKQVAAALSRVLGTADAAADLERRMRFPLMPVRPSTQDAVDAARLAVAGATAGTLASGAAAASIASADDTANVDATAQWDPQPDFTAHPLRDMAPASPATPDATPLAAPQAKSSRPIDQRRRRLVFVLVGLVLVSLLIGIIGLVISNKTGGSKGGSKAGGASAGAAAGTAYAISGVDDFDPSADGGNNEENPNELALAHDGKTSTAWQTVTYLNNAKLGKLKPGVGIVVDLGSAKTIGSVKLTLQGSPTGVSILVPTDAKATSAPMSTAKQWRTIASNASAGTNVTLTPTQATTSRFVLVYLTSLPTVGANKYRGGIAEVQVLS